MDVVQSLRAIVGNDGVLDAKETATRAAGAMRFDTLVAQALVRPKTTEQVSAVVRWCNDNGLRVVTHGGLTGLVQVRCVQRWRCHSSE
jgi:FAD/FMN-containing dehydrogenase